MTPAEPDGVHHALRRYLLDGESIVTAVHQHWAKVAEPVASAVLGLVLVVWVGSIAPAGLSRLADALWWPWFVLVARLIWRLLEWRHDWFVATDKRLLLTYGLITRKVAMMPLTKVTDMSYSRSPTGRVLGYGRFTLESAGQEQALREIDWLPDPDRTYRAICAEIFGVGGPLSQPEAQGEDSVWRDEPVARAHDIEPRRAVSQEGSEHPSVEESAEHPRQIPVRGAGRDLDGRSGRSVHRNPDVSDPSPEPPPSSPPDDGTGPITPWPSEPSL